MSNERRDEILRRLGSSILPMPIIAVPSWSGLIAGAAELSKLIGGAVLAVQQAYAPLGETFRIIGEQTSISELVVTAGWLPHRTTPFGRLSADMSAESVDLVLSEHYETCWQMVEDDFLAAAASYSIDDEGKACFGEAVRAHQMGLYRIAPRLLFPEIERIARLELHGGAHGPITSQRQLRADTAELGLSELATTGIPGLALFRKFEEHLYAKVETEAQRQAASLDLVPNRHAALHGVVSYNTAKSSLNMLVMADFILGAISAIKANRASPEDGG